MLFVYIFAIFIALAASVVLFFKHKFTYWSRRNVPGPAPRMFMGNLPHWKYRRHLSLYLQQVYTEMRKTQLDFCGLYLLYSPTILALSPKFVQLVLVKDSHVFLDRGLFYNKKDDPLSANMANLDGPEWKLVRTKFSSAFSPSKLRQTIPTTVQMAEEMLRYLNGLIPANGPTEVDLNDLLSRYTADVIGACGFGLKVNCLKDRDTYIRKMFSKEFIEPRHQTFMVFLMIAYKDLARKLGMKFLRDDVAEFFMHLIVETIEIRERSGCRGQDLLDTMIEIKNHGTCNGNEIGSLTMEQIAAQAFIIFLAGYDNLSTFMLFCLFELSRNPKIQEAARLEIENVLAKTNGKIQYGTLLDMPYVDRIIKETSRKYSPTYMTVRRCTADYPIPETDVVIEKGTYVGIPIHAIHNDPAYYPDPARFNPDRFSPEHIATRPKYAFLPFGAGPRYCIGKSFATGQMRIMLITLLRHFELSQCDRTPETVELQTNGPLHVARGEFFVRFKRLK